MNSQATFWAIAGFMAGLAAAFFLVTIWRRGGGAGLQRIDGWLLAALLVFLVGAMVIYAGVGHPPSATLSDVSPPDHAQAASGNDAGSVADSVARLVARLAKGAGSDADWTLLQQSYEFMGDTAAAALAAQHKLPEGTPKIVAMPVLMRKAQVTDVVLYQKRVAADPRDVTAWRALAESYRTARQFTQANAAFAQLVKLKAMDADAWADYADAVASQTGSLANQQTRSALNEALRLNARHPKALWLQASLLLEEKRYAESLMSWRQLRAVIDSNSPDAKIIDANIAEVASLMGASVTANQGKAVAKVAAATVHGSVNIDATQVGKASGLTLFVFAKAADSPAPVAVYRTTVNAWPASFTLDDAQAMMPARKLSNYAQVLVQARLSLSGEAMARPGDWQSDAVPVSTQSGKPVALLIRQPVVAKAGS